MSARPFGNVAATAVEHQQRLPGDDVLPAANVVMTRAFTLDAAPAEVWPWLQQLGKGRAGWYLPAAVERLMPRLRRAIRTIDDQWQRLAVGDVIPDYGGKHETFTVHQIQPPDQLVYASQRRNVTITWSISLHPAGDQTRVMLRLRMQGVKRTWLANTVGDLFDALTIAGMAAGLRERLAALA
jgi:hypothetical protein